MNSHQIPNEHHIKQQSLIRKLLMDRSQPGRIGAHIPQSDVPKQQQLPNKYLRKELPLPEVSESEIVRYFSQLSQFNFSIDHNFYPLGSCTMKYNPKINDEIASLPGLSEIHPLQPEESIQGALKIIFELQNLLAEITGFDSTSLAPMAGAEAELAGMLITRSFHKNNGDTHKTKILITDSAHGTNPASAVMAGFDVISIPSDKNGNTDIEALKAAINDDLAGLMLTQPSTLGLFDTNIIEICKRVKDAGGILYGDGANLNALLGRIKPGELGFDILHSNLHKTFTQPHGGGGPGAGAIMVSKKLTPYLPSPIVQYSKDEDFYSIYTPKKSIGRMGGFHGNFGALVRAYSYIKTLGKEGIDQISKDAVINANYIKSNLEEYFELPIKRICMHEVVFSASNFKKHNGIKALDISKRLIDYGIHPPTMYFPLIIDEALMIEPTETESKETLDYFISSMIKIASEAKQDPELLRNAPHNTPNSRLDEALAARKPNLRWQKKD
tara:strand:+ start:25627 stop:27123 length:1497 start_codon:yes stop_codon:yes gene_type:complete